MKSLLTGLLAILWLSLQAQQLYLEGFGTLNRTRYSTTEFSNASDYLGYGGRLAIGADHVQLGGEYRSNISDPKFEGQVGTTSFEETYFGGFIRTKISRYPAMRFGLVLRAGGGIYNTTAHLDTNLGKYSQNTTQFSGSTAALGSQFRHSSTPCWSWAIPIITCNDPPMRSRYRSTMHPTI
ncbi:MAG: hypothetical protein IPM82_25170 [Saprospiraceae bacterium]|nr:hypothetical protein [Saprospiraceae bacterium]